MRQIKNILIIDDDEVSNFITTKIVEHSGLSENITSLSSGIDGLSYLENEFKANRKGPEVIMLDLMMHEINGWEFLLKFEELDSIFKSDILLYILTTSISDRDKKMAANYKCISGFFQKPLTIDLVDELRKKLWKNKNKKFNALSAIFSIW